MGRRSPRSLPSITTRQLTRRCSPATAMRSAVIWDSSRSTANRRQSGHQSSFDSVRTHPAGSPQRCWGDSQNNSPSGSRPLGSVCSNSLRNAPQRPVCYAGVVAIGATHSLHSPSPSQVPGVSRRVRAPNGTPGWQQPPLRCLHPRPPHRCCPRCRSRTKPVLTGDSQLDRISARAP